MLKRFTVAMVLLVLFGLSPCQAFDGYNPSNKYFKLQTEVFNVIHQYWAVTDLFLAYTANPTDENYNALINATDIYKKISLDLGKKLLSSLEDKNREVIEVISDIYKSFDPNCRQPFYDFVGFLKTAIIQEYKGVLTEAEFREYFPGYGYTEPGYKYRKGREVERENKGITWQSEEHSITTTFNVELTINIDLLGILQGLLSSGVIKDLKVGPKFETNVNGQPMIVCKVSFQVIKAITTKTNRKFEVNKIWFELLRAKISGWTVGPFELCGKTYEIINEPTGEEVVTGLTQQ